VRPKEAFSPDNACILFRQMQTAAQKYRKMRISIVHLPFLRYNGSSYKKEGAES
jgi:hypothetical protein